MEHITSRTNPKIVNAIKLRNKKYRELTSLFFFEGYKVFSEAVEAGLQFEHIFVREDALKTYPKLAEYEKVITVSSSVYSKLTDDAAADGVFCVAKKLPQKTAAGNKKLMLISVRDPGNVGTIIRSALAFGIDELVLSDDCADIYSPKTIRGTMGALFKQNISIVSNPHEYIRSIQQEGYNVCAAALKDSAISLDELTINSKTCFVIGNEGHGLDDEIINICDKQVIIPISQHSESLNAAIAASILMWELKRST